MSKQIVTIAKHLRVARRIKGITQREAAREINVTRTTWNHWETGRALPSSVNVPALAAWLGIATGDLAEAIVNEEMAAASV